MNKFDLSGEKFGRLTVIYKVKSTDKNSRWLCLCECGQEISVSRVHLKNGHTTSCGCYQKIKAAENAKINKTTHGLSNTNIYKVWDSLRYRCYNPNCHAFKDYGGRGIHVCEEWKDSFESFYEWAISSGYQKGLSIDRIDVNGDYEPGNCRWASMKSQGNNRRSTVKLTLNGETKSMKEWAETYGIPYATLQKRMRKPGADLLRALTEHSRRVAYG